MELRPFRSLRYSARTIEERGLATLVAADPLRSLEVANPSTGAPENILRVAGVRSENGEPARAAATLASWLASGVLRKEKRPGLWIERQSRERDGRTSRLAMLVGLVRLGAAAREVELPQAEEPGIASAERLELLRALRADFQPCLLLTRAPLAPPLATTRRPDLSFEERDGLRHDLFRIPDYAQHVELQGLVKNAEVVLARGIDLWETSRELEADPGAAKLPGSRYKLCALLDRASLREVEQASPGADDLLPRIPAGLFGVSLEDPVY